MDQQAQEETVNWTKEYYYVDEVSDISFHDDYVELHLKRRSGHIFIGHPITLPQLAASKEILKGDWVRVDFIQNGYSAIGVHRLLELRKATLEDLDIAAKQGEL